jgi:hypothetical protein
VNSRAGIFLLCSGEGVDERYKLRFIFLIAIFALYQPNTKTINYEKISTYIGLSGYVCRAS